MPVPSSNVIGVRRGNAGSDSRRSSRKANANVDVRVTSENSRGTNGSTSVGRKRNLELATAFTYGPRARANSIGHRSLLPAVHQVEIEDDLVATVEIASDFSSSLSWQ